MSLISNHSNGKNYYRLLRLLFNTSKSMITVYTCTYVYIMNEYFLH